MHTRGEKIRMRFILTGTIVAIIAAALVGIGINRSSETFDTLLSWLEIAGKGWMICVMVIVVPLVAFYLFYVIFSMLETKSLGRIGLKAILVHLGFIACGIAILLIFGLGGLEIMKDHLPHLTADALSPPANGKGTNELEILQRVNWLLGFFGNLILVVIFGSIAAALVIGFGFRSRVNALNARLSAYAAKTLDIFQYFLVTMPFAVFALTLPMVVADGSAVLGAAVFCIVIQSAIHILFILAIYFAVHRWGLHDIRDFARAMMPANLVAATTRSSMATMPVMLDVAQNRMGIPVKVAGVIIPFFVSVFRPNKIMTTPLGFLIMTYLYGLELNVGIFTSLLLFHVLLSFGSPGVPSTGKYTAVAFFLAAGIPLEGYILMKAVNTLPDIFMTLLNVTEVMGITSITAKASLKETPELAIQVQAE